MSQLTFVASLVLVGEVNAKKTLENLNLLLYCV